MTTNTQTSADATRRRFLCKAGAALSVPLAAAAGAPTAAATDDSAALRARLALLEDANAIRALQHAYAQRVNAGGGPALDKLFVGDVPTRGFRTFCPDPHGGDDSIDIDPGAATATAREHCVVEIETAIEPSCPLVEMARAQGGGVLRRSERGVLESEYVKLDGVWKIGRVEFRR